MTDPNSSAEADRCLALVHELGLSALHDVPELDALVRLAADVTEAPMAVIGVIDETQLHFVARHALNLGSVEQAGSFCAESIHQNEDLTVADACVDTRFAGHALVVREPFVRSYVGVVLRVHGLALATLGVLDHRVRDFDARQLDALADLATVATRWLEDRHTQLHAPRERAQGWAFTLRLGEVLRKPLQMLAGHSQMLLIDGATSLAPSALRHLEQAQRAAERIGKLFEDVRRLVRAQITPADRWQDVDLDVVANYAIERHTAQANRERVHLRHIAWREPVHAAADLGAVMQIIAELLGNGIRYNLRDASLTLATSVRGELACLSFTDQGLGLDAAQMARLFEPLAPLHPAVHGDGPEPSGLGLVIAQALARAMGGDIRADCRTGAGCTFTLELPLRRAGSKTRSRQSQGLAT